VPVDASFHRVEPLRAAARLMPRARITVLHALDPRREQLMRITETPPRAVRLRREHVSAKVLGWMQGLVARAGLDPAAVVCRVAYGDAWSSTLALQEELAADALVLMKRPVHGFTDFVWGSTVRRLLALAECDVLVVQPDSPVGAAQSALRSRRESSGGPKTAHAAQALPAGSVDEGA
jgi:nucleotide-binding universal stress UspA family protein